MHIELEHLPADLLGLSEIARKALAAGPGFAPIPVVRRIEDIPTPAERHDPTERAELARAITRGLETLDPPSRVRTSLQVLAREGVSCVVTGQQPGLLCGPLLTLYKAMQACRLAAELAGVWGRPVVPVFWNHGDDHDVAEVHHSYILNTNLDLQKVGLAGLSSGREPISRILLSDERNRLGAIRELLAQSHHGAPHLEAALELFLPRDGESLVRTMSRALTALLGEHGLVVVEPDWIRGDLSRALADVVARDVAAGLRAGGELLDSAGIAEAIDPGAAALLYRVDERGRTPLRFGGEGFRFPDESGSRTGRELAAEIVQEPEAWSPGALLRPIVQDRVFPTAAYVGGFGELAYHAQLGPLRDLAEVPRTPFAPRVSCTIVDGESRRSLERLEASVRDALEGRGNPLHEEPGSSATPPVATHLRNETEAFIARLKTHKQELAALEPGLATGLDRAAAQIRGQIDKLIGKAERVHSNRSGKGRRHLRRIANDLYPRNQPQERVLGPFTLTARFGRDWLDALWSELPAVASEHFVVHLTEEDAGQATA